MKKTFRPKLPFLASLCALTIAAFSAIAAAPAHADDDAIAPAVVQAHLGDIQKAAAVVEPAGTPAPKTVLYVFMDPNCIFCHYAWKALHPYEKVGLEIHWIPMGFLKPDSAGKAAALLESKNGPALLTQLETKFDEKKESGGIAPLDPVPAATKAKLDANIGLFQQIGFQGTPAIVYKDESGKWAAMDGLPRLGTLPAFLHLPAQPLDASLQKYR